MKKIHITFDEIEILEWYDGIVRATCKAENEIYLLILVAWDMKQLMKLSILLKLDESTKNDITKELGSNRSKEENWKRFNLIFDDYVRSYAGEAYLIQGEIKENKTYNLKIINSNYIKNLATYEFEDTMSRDTINFWLKM